MILYIYWWANIHRDQGLIKIIHIRFCRKASDQLLVMCLPEVTIDTYPLHLRIVEHWTSRWTDLYRILNALHGKPLPGFMVSYVSGIDAGLVPNPQQWCGGESAGLVLRKSWIESPTRLKTFRHVYCKSLKVVSSTLVTEGKLPRFRRSGYGHSLCTLVERHTLVSSYNFIEGYNLVEGYMYLGRRIYHGRGWEWSSLPSIRFCKLSGRGATVSACADLTNQLLSCWVDPRMYSEKNTDTAIVGNRWTGFWATPRPVLLTGAKKSNLGCLISFGLLYGLSEFRCH